MKKSNLTLLVLLLSAFSAFCNLPCKAETVQRKNELNKEISTENISANENQNERSPSNSLVDSASVKSAIISENSEKATPVNNTQTNVKPASRVPIGCRFFAAPSMQQ